MLGDTLKGYATLFLGFFVGLGEESGEFLLYIVALAVRAYDPRFCF